MFLSIKSLAGLLIIAFFLAACSSGEIDERLIKLYVEKHAVELEKKRLEELKKQQRQRNDNYRRYPKINEKTGYIKIRKKGKDYDVNMEFSPGDGNIFFQMQIPNDSKGRGYGNEIDEKKSIVFPQKDAKSGYQRQYGDTAIRDRVNRVESIVQIKDTMLPESKPKSKGKQISQTKVLKNEEKLSPSQNQPAQPPAKQKQTTSQEDSPDISDVKDAPDVKENQPPKTTTLEDGGIKRQNLEWKEINEDVGKN